MLISQLLFLCYTNYQNLNTSNVNVNLPSNSTGFILQRNLNTSNVNVNLKILISLFHSNSYLNTSNVNVNPQSLGDNFLVIFI